jgi:hypothetical protein
LNDCEASYWIERRGWFVGRPSGDLLLKSYCPLVLAPALNL